VRSGENCFLVKTSHTWFGKFLFMYRTTRTFTLNFDAQLLVGHIHLFFAIRVL